MTDYPTGAWPENSRLVKITFRGEVETKIGSGIKSRFAMTGF